MSIQRAVQFLRKKTLKILPFKFLRYYVKINSPWVSFDQDHYMTEGRKVEVCVEVIHTHHVVSEKFFFQILVKVKSSDPYDNFYLRSIISSNWVEFTRKCYQTLSDKKIFYGNLLKKEQARSVFFYSCHRVLLVTPIQR